MLFFNLSAFYFFYFAAIAVYIIFMPTVLKNLLYSTLEIGIIFAIAPLIRFITPFVFLNKIQLNQRIFKIFLIISLISTAMFYLTIHSFYLFMITNLFLGIGWSIILPYIEVIALKNLGKQKYGKSRLFGSLGFMLIALILAKFLNQPNIAIHYYFITIVFTIFFSFVLLKYDISHKEEISYKRFSFLKYWSFWLSLFFMQVSFGSFYNFFTIYELEQGISLEAISYLWAFGVICEIVMLYFQAPLLKKNLLNIIKFSIAITALRWLLLYLFPDNLIIIYATQSIHAFSFGLYHSAIIMYLYTLYENKKLAQQFMYGIAYGLGGFIGALSAGKLYGEYLFLYSALFALISFLFLNIKTSKMPST